MGQSRPRDARGRFMKGKAPEPLPQLRPFPRVEIEVWALPPAHDVLALPVLERTIDGLEVS